MQALQPSQPDGLTHVIQRDGVRLDRALADWRGISRAAVGRLLERGAIQCNGHVVGRRNKGDLLQAGDRIELLAEYAGGEAPLPDASIELAVLARGEGWLAVNKPAGVPVRPHALGEKGTVINAVTAIEPEVVGVGEGGLRSGVVHRLDNDTSGALLVATRQGQWDRFRAAFAEHRIQKRYAAIVYGTPDDAGVARRDLSITSHQPARVLVEPEGKGAKASRTCSLGWRVLERFGHRASLVEVDLHTGFLHQVRAMMSDLGHPVIGDAVYGNTADSLSAPRQILHAKSLAFEEVAVDAPLPEEMQQLMQSLRG